MIYGCIEHRTWAFLRNEGDFDTDATADGIADMVFGGLVVRASPKTSRWRRRSHAWRMSPRGSSGWVG